MKPPSIDDRCVLLYTARLVLRAREPQVVLERLTSGGRVASLTTKGLWLVQQYMEVLTPLLGRHDMVVAERLADEMICDRYGWPTMAALGYQPQVSSGAPLDYTAQE